MYVPEIGEEKKRPQALPEKCDVTAVKAKQAPGPPTIAVTQQREPTSDLEEVFDVNCDDDASGTSTDDEPQ